MCDFCTAFAAGRPATRRRFLKHLAGGLAVAAGMTCTRIARAQTVASAPTGRASWARLITSSPFWSLHSEQDPIIADFIRREARVNFDGANYAVSPAEIADLANYPLIFTNSLIPVTDPRQLDNLKEYLRRGGFFYIEGCLDHRMTRNFAAFMVAHLTLFEQFLPNITARRFGPGHPIFQVRFPVDEAQLALIAPTVDDERWKGAPQALYGIYQGDRIVSVISLDHLQCEWFTKPAKIPLCLQQIANIYVYALTR